MKHTIWSNDIDISDENIKTYRDDMTNLDPDETWTDEQIIQFMYDDIDVNLDAETENIKNIDMIHSNTILVTGTLGLWHGTVMGYKLLENAALKDIFSTTIGDYIEFYENDGNIQCSDTHHDGTNHYVYRELKTDDLDDPDIEEMLDAIATAGKDLVKQQKAWDLINKHTYSLSHYWQELYGWKD